MQYAVIRGDGDSGQTSIAITAHGASVRRYADAPKRAVIATRECIYRFGVSLTICLYSTIRENE